MQYQSQNGMELLDWRLHWISCFDLKQYTCEITVASIFCAAWKFRSKLLLQNFDETIFNNKFYLLDDIIDKIPLLDYTTSFLHPLTAFYKQQAAEWVLKLGIKRHFISINWVEANCYEI